MTRYRGAVSGAGFTIEAALQPSWDDLTRSRPGLLSMELAPPDDEIAVWLRAADGFATGIWRGVLTVAEPVSAATAVVVLADQLQEAVIEALWGVGLPAAWPRCPQHPRGHPLAPREALARPTWCCPVTGYEADEIGHLR